MSFSDSQQQLCLLFLFLGDGPRYRDLVIKHGSIQPILALLVAVPDLAVFPVSLRQSVSGVLRHFLFSTVQWTSFSLVCFFQTTCCTHPHCQLQLRVFD